MPPTEAPARDRLLDAAEELMLSRGYGAASVDAICAAAGVTKGSFFHHFSSKLELGKVLLQRFSQRQNAGFAATLGALEDPLDRVFAVVDLVIAAAGDPEMKGCLVGKFAQEISHTQPELRAICQQTFEGFASGLGADFVAAKARHCPEAAFDAESLGGMFMALAQGSMLIRRATGDPTPMVQSLTHFRDYLSALYGRSPRALET